MHHRYYLAPIFVALLCLPAWTSAESVDHLKSKHKQDYEQRLQSIEALTDALDRVAAEKGKKRDFKEIKSSLNTALKQADAKFTAEDYVEGRRLLDEIYRTVVGHLTQLREGETLVKQRKADETYSIAVTRPKAELDYESRSKSVNALLQAFGRVSLAEKIDAVGTREQASRIIKDATNTAEKGNFTEALQLLNEAYTLIQGKLVNMRDGKTLVRTLNFATPVEEYAYYVEKTNSQIDAITMILNGVSNRSKIDSLERTLTAARHLVGEAKALADDGHHAESIPLMDKALTRLQSGLMMAVSSL